MIPFEQKSSKMTWDCPGMRLIREQQSITEHRLQKKLIGLLEDALVGSKCSNVSDDLGMSGYKTLQSRVEKGVGFN